MRNKRQIMLERVQISRLHVKPSQLQGYISGIVGFKGKHFPGIREITLRKSARLDKGPINGAVRTLRFPN